MLWIKKLKKSDTAKLKRPDERFHSKVVAGCGNTDSHEVDQIETTTTDTVVVMAVGGGGIKQPPP